VLYEAFQSTLTTDAMLELAYQATQGNPLAIVLIDLLPTAISRRLQ
jgi:hypothetical protein